MIGRIFKGKTYAQRFTNLTRYLLVKGSSGLRSDDEVEVLYQPFESLEGADRSKLATQLGRLMQSRASRRKQCKVPVWHATISLAPGESLESDQWMKVVERVTRVMGFVDPTRSRDCLWFAIRHRDTEAHPKYREHIHIGACRVYERSKGVYRTVSDSHDHYHLGHLMRSLEKEFSLTELHAPGYAPVRSPGLRYRPLMNAKQPCEMRVHITHEVDAALNTGSMDGFLSYLKEARLLLHAELEHPREGLVFYARHPDSGHLHYFRSRDLGRSYHPRELAKRLGVRTNSLLSEMSSSHPGSFVKRMGVSETIKETCR